MSADLQDFREFVELARAAGARRARCGEMEVEFGPAPAAPESLPAAPLRLPGQPSADAAPRDIRHPALWGPAGPPRFPTP